MSDTKRPVSAGAEELLGRYFPVLDHGFVALVDYMGTDECVERAARRSPARPTPLNGVALPQLSPESRANTSKRCLPVSESAM